MALEAACALELTGQATIQAALEEQDVEEIAPDQLPEDSATKQSGGILKGLWMLALARAHLQ